MAKLPDEFKDLDIKFQMDDDSAEKGTFTGYASIFGVIDSYNDIVEKGAFKKTLLDRDKDPIKMLWSHDVTQPIGIIQAKEDKNGLKVEGQLNLDVLRAQEIRSLMKQGAISGLSIGYETVRSEPDEVDKKNVRRLQELKLYEISPVVFGACPGALVSAVKTAPTLPDEEPTPVTLDGKPQDDISKPEHIHLLEEFRDKVLELKNFMEANT